MIYILKKHQTHLFTQRFPKVTLIWSDEFLITQNNAELNWNSGFHETYIQTIRLYSES